MTQPPPASKLAVDPWIALPAAALVVIGFANLHALGDDGVSVSRLATRQFVWAALGLVAAAGAYRLARSDRHRALAWGHAASAAAVLLTLLGFAAQVRSVRRWIALGPLLVQPSEFLKLGVVLAVARWLGDAPMGSRGLARTVVAVLAVVTLPMALVAAQPDFGSAVLLGLVAASTIAVTPRAVRSLAVLALSSAVPLALGERFVLKAYQYERVRALVWPERYAGPSWQARQALSAMGSSRWFGSEPSWLTTHHLPDAHTDFALVAWADAHGLAGTLALLGLAAVIVHRAFSTALRARECFDVAVAAGVGAMLLWQTALHAAVNLGALPVVGVPLPLVSYGGSNLVTTLAAIGALLGVRARVQALAPEPAAPGPERLYRGAPEA